MCGHQSWLPAAPRIALAGSLPMPSRTRESAAEVASPRVKQAYTSFFEATNTMPIQLIGKPTLQAAAPCTCSPVNPCEARVVEDAGLAGHLHDAPRHGADVAPRQPSPDERGSVGGALEPIRATSTPRRKGLGSVSGGCLFGTARVGNAPAEARCWWAARRYCRALGRAAASQVYKGAVLRYQGGQALHQAQGQRGGAHGAHATADGVERHQEREMVCGQPNTPA
jgi:hypothetical protein